MIKEFREFAIKGNAIDMAIGVVIGSAFALIVKSLVEDIIMPPIGFLLGNVDFSNLFFVIKEGQLPGPYITSNEAVKAGAIVIRYGIFFNAIISFLIISFSIFILIKQINRFHEKNNQSSPEAELKQTKEILLLSEIRDLLKNK